MFGVGKKSYEFGGGLNFKTWMTRYHPSQWRALHRVIGNRFDVMFENALPLYLLWDCYQEFLTERAKYKDFNKLEKECLELLNANWVKAAVRARGIMFIQVWQPWRALINDRKTLKLSFLDMTPVIVRLNDEKNQAVEADEKGQHIVNRDYQVFKNDGLKAITDRYRQHHSEAVDAIFASDSALDEKTAKLVKAMWVGLTKNPARFNIYFADHLPGGKYYNLSAELRSTLKHFYPHNIPIESHFALYDHSYNRAPNASSLAVNGVVAWIANSTEAVLGTLLPETFEVVIDSCWAKEPEDFKASKEHERKMAEDALTGQEQLAIKKEATRHKELVRSLHTLSSEELAASSSDMKTALSNKSNTAKRKLLRAQCDLLLAYGCAKSLIPKFQKFKKDVDTDVLTEQVGSVLDMARRSGQLVPPDCLTGSPWDKQLEQFKALRESEVTEKVSDARKKKLEQLQKLKREVDEHARIERAEKELKETTKAKKLADMNQLQALKAQKSAEQMNAKRDKERAKRQALLAGEENKRGWVCCDMCRKWRVCTARLTRIRSGTAKKFTCADVCADKCEAPCEWCPLGPCPCDAKEVEEANTATANETHKNKKGVGDKDDEEDEDGDEDEEDEDEEDGDEEDADEEDEGEEEEEESEEEEEESEEDEDEIAAGVYASSSLALLKPPEEGRPRRARAKPAKYTSS